MSEEIIVGEFEIGKPSEPKSEGGDVYCGHCEFLQDYGCSGDDCIINLNKGGKWSQPGPKCKPGKYVMKLVKIEEETS